MNRDSESFIFAGHHNHSNLSFPEESKNSRNRNVRETGWDGRRNCRWHHAERPNSLDQGTDEVATSGMHWLPWKPFISLETVDWASNSCLTRPATSMPNVLRKSEPKNKRKQFSLMKYERTSTISSPCASP